MTEDAAFLTSPPARTRNGGDCGIGAETRDPLLPKRGYGTATRSQSEVFPVAVPLLRGLNMTARRRILIVAVIVVLLWSWRISRTGW